MPAITRWGTHQICLQILIENKVALQKAIKEYKPDAQKQIDKRNVVYELLFNEEFWDSVDLLNTLLRSVTIATRIVEGDKSSISKVIAAFQKVNNDIHAMAVSPLKTSALASLVKRYNAVNNDQVIVAFLLDPTNNTNNISTDFLSTLQRLINARFPQNPQKANEVFEIAAQFVAKSGVCHTSKPFWSNPPTNGLLWWQTYGSFINKDLKELVIEILSIPASSASAERNWSAYGFVHSKTRNRLTTDNAEMLTFLYDNSKTKKNT